MQKQKFELSSDLIKIESEPEPKSKPELTQYMFTRLGKHPAKEIKDQLNLRISAQIKNDFKVWCIKNLVNMTDGLEMALKDLMKKNLLL